MFQLITFWLGSHWRQQQELNGTNEEREEGASHIRGAMEVFNTYNDNKDDNNSRKHVK